MSPVTNTKTQDRVAKDNTPQETAAQYDLVRRQIIDDPGDWTLQLEAADLAMSLQDRRSARAHIQKALDASPYNARVVRAATRKLTRDELQGLRLFERPEAPWENPQQAVGYLWSRGPIYLGTVALGFFALSWVWPTQILAVAALVVWMLEIVRTTSNGVSEPPLWHGALREPVSVVLKPLIAMLVLCAGLLSPPLLVIQGLIASNVVVGDNGLAVLVASPLLIVILSTVGFLYLPASLMIVGGSPDGYRRVWDPRRVFRAIVVMEREYLICLLVLGVMGGLCALFAMMTAYIPVLGRLVAIALGVCASLIGAWLVGRLLARFREELDLR